VRLVSFEGGFGRVDGELVVPMGDDLVRYLAGEQSREAAPRPLSHVQLLSPVPVPKKIVCVGLNYRDHALETGQAIPAEPILFAKYANSVIGSGDAIRLPRSAPERVDYEAELAVVIGRPASQVPVSRAVEHVAGYTCANDVSARDLQMHSSQWMLGKAVDTFLPLGPCLVTCDEISDPQNLNVRCTVNGEVLQDSNTSQMIFGVAQLVSFVSQTITLAPGDLIITGTPSGVGFTRTPPRFLRPGDRVTVSIEGIGDLSNPVRGQS
jgi:2-keto-4-pentenoate hydratase/2-oxohepta-3-ene-1,7-dioic acid hydratase in catechol pathway